MGSLQLLSRCFITCNVGVSWGGGDQLGEKFQSMIQEDEVVNEIMAQVTTVVDGQSYQVTLTIIDFFATTVSQNAKPFMSLTLQTFPRLYKMVKIVNASF